MRWRSPSLIAAAAVLFVTVAAVLGVVITWPDVAALRRVNPTTTAFIERYRERRRDAGESEAVAWEWTSWESISPDLKRAVVAAEDMEFFGHRGFSTSEMRAALRKAWEGQGTLRGASTITQQLAKNLWLSPSRSPSRKIREAILTWQLERNLSKRRILELYLNVVEFGPGIYGARAAAAHYFGTSPSALDEHESAQLAAGLPRPSRWHPGVETDAYRQYVAEIERRMAVAEFLWRYLEEQPGATPRGEPPPVVPETLPAVPPVDTATSGGG